MQRRVAIWILGVFKTSLTEGIEALAGLIPIKLHITKLRGRSQLRAMSLSPNHIIRSLMDSPFSSDKHHHPSSLRCFTEQQKTKIKGHLINANNRSYDVVSSLSFLYSEFSPGLRIIDTFSNQFFLNLSNKEKNDKNRLHQLDSMVIESSSTTSTTICNDLKLELRLHLGKDLRKYKGWIEVVKHKDTGMYLCYLYESIVQP